MWAVLGAGPLVVALINFRFTKRGNLQSLWQRAERNTGNVGFWNVMGHVGSFFSAIPISGSFSRSAVNDSSEVQSQLGGLFTGLLVLFSSGFLTPSFYWIPKSSLAAVIIAAVICMIELRALIVMWKINRMDLLSCLITFLASVLLGMEYDIMVGVGISLSALLLESLKPSLHPELRTDPSSGINFFYLKLEAGLTFPSVDYIRSSVTKIGAQHSEYSIIVINFEKWTTLDYTSVTGLISLIKRAKKEGKDLILVDCGMHWIHAFQVAGLDINEIPHCTSCEFPAYLRNKTSEISPAQVRHPIMSRNSPTTSRKGEQKSPLKTSPSINANDLSLDGGVFDYGAVSLSIQAQEGAGANDSSSEPLL